MFRNTPTTAVLVAGLAGCFVLAGTLFVMALEPSIASNGIGVSS